MQHVLQVELLQILMKELNSSLQSILIDSINVAPFLMGAAQEREINK